MCTRCCWSPRRSRFLEARSEGAQWCGSKLLLDPRHPRVQLIQVHSTSRCLQCEVPCFFLSQSCQSNVVRSCAGCKKDFKKSTSLSGHRVRGRRTKARSLAACWQRCKEKPDCRFVNWVFYLFISPLICHSLIIEVTLLAVILDH